MSQENRDSESSGPQPPRLVFVGRTHDAHIDALIAAGYHVVGVTDVREALKHRPRPHGIILELKVPERDLAELGDWRGGPHTAALTVIGLAGEDTKDAVTKAGATFCRHPCPPEELVEILKRVIPLIPLA